MKLTKHEKQLERSVALLRRIYSDLLYKPDLTETERTLRYHLLIPVSDGSKVSIAAAAKAIANAVTEMSTDAAKELQHIYRAIKPVQVYKELFGENVLSRGPAPF